MFDLASVAATHIGSELPYCLDLTCGDGENLVRLADTLWDHQTLAKATPAERVETILSHLVGFDVDPTAVDRAAAALLAWANARSGAERTHSPKVATIPNVLALVTTKQRDLFRDLANLDHLFDIAIASIPFHPLDSSTREASREHLPWVTGRFSSEAPYVSALWSMLAPDGVAVMTVRDVFFRRVYGGDLLSEFRPTIRLLSAETDAERLCVVVVRGEAGTTLDAIRTGGDPARAEMLQTIENFPPLEHYLADLPGEAFRTDPLDLYLDDGPFSRAVVTSDDVARWVVEPRTVFWPYDVRGETLTTLPSLIEQRFEPWRSRLATRAFFGLDMAQRGRDWFEFVTKSNVRSDTSPTIVFVTRDGASAAAVSETPLPATAGAMNLTPTDPDASFWLAGLLNSSVGTFWMQSTFAVTTHDDDRVTQIEPTGVQLRSFPIAPNYRAEIESISRSLHDASELLASLPGDDLEQWEQTVIDAHARVRTLERDLDTWVERAYDVSLPAREEKGVKLDPDVVMQATLEKILVQELITLSDRARLPFDRPFAIAEAVEELKKDRRTAEILDRVSRDLAQIVLDHSVPDVDAWISNAVTPRHLRDYVGYRSNYPPSTKADSRRRIFRLRGPLNLATETFVHLAEWSDALHHPIFCRAPLPKLPDVGQIQFDLGRIAEMETWIAEATPIDALIVRFSRAGWTLGDIRACLVLLEEQGRVVLDAERVVPTD